MDKVDGKFVILLEVGNVLSVDDLAMLQHAGHVAGSVEQLAVAT